MDNICFGDSWEQYFKSFGLSAFDDFYQHCGDSTVGRNTRRSVQKFTLGDDANRKVFFIKKFHNPQLKDKISAVYNYGWPASQARVEWDNAWYLLNNGIGTYKPVCMGERSGMGIEKDSFIVTEELESVCLVDFVIENWHLLERSRHEKIIVAAAELVREVQELGVSFPDLYLWHVFINPDRPDEKEQLSIIDLHRMRQKGLSRRKRIKELGKLYWSMSSDYFDQEQKELLITAYIDGDSFDRTDAMKIIRRCSAVLDKRRTLNNYYRVSKV